jgi:hypothetical protein
VVPLVLALVWIGVSPIAINLGVAAVVGGPHLWSTFVATYADARFRRAHGAMLAGAALLVPAFVVAMTFADFQVLLSVFIFLASVHVLQQNAYLTDIYRRRAGRPEPAWSRLLDYAFLGLSFYPIAAYKLVHGTFVLGDVVILATWMVSGAAFALLAVAWAAKTAAERRCGVLNVPKTVLIGLTAAIAFLVPAAAGGANLELAFQAVNMWHSIQYLGIVWLILSVRRRHGLLENRIVASLAARPARFYGACFALTLALFGIVAALVAVDPFRMRFDRYYYMVILSVLLIHYVVDGYLFAVSNRAGARFETMPYAAPAALG